MDSSPFQSALQENSETTELRDAYVGFLLTDAEAIVFAAANVDDTAFVDALLADGRASGTARLMLADHAAGDPSDLGSDGATP